MTNTAAIAEEPVPLRACTICRDVQRFDLLVEDMEALLGSAWGDLSIPDGIAFLTQEEAGSLDFLVIAMDAEDAADSAGLARLVTDAVARNLGVIVTAERVDRPVLDGLADLGASVCLPYPLAEGALHNAVAGLRAPTPRPPEPPPQPAPVASSARPSGASGRDGVVLPVHGLAGGVGATTFAVNLADALRRSGGDTPPRVALLDLDLQMGAVATYLDLPQREAVIELLSDTETMDAEVLMQSMAVHADSLHVLTAPPEMLPLDMVGPADIDRLIGAAAAEFDYVVIDMPSTLVQWTETVLARAHVYFALIEIDMRSAQNALRLIRALKSEDLPSDKLRFAMNRAPGLADLSGKSRLRRLAESLGVSIEVRLPDGGAAVAAACDSGAPLSVAGRRNPLRKEIDRIAATAHALNRDAIAT